METTDNPNATPKPEAKPRCASATGSADLRGYAKGYAAGIKRLKSLEAEIAKLKEIKTPPPLPDSHDVTIEYLITTAEAMVGAANMLIQMRSLGSAESSPNAELSESARSNQKP